MQKIITIQDTKAQAFLPPFYAKTTAEAIRTFGSSCSDPKSMFNQHPKDFILIEIGTFDDETGLITPCEHHNIATGADFVAQ